MSIVSLARFQFAMTTIFHFFFVPFSIGLAVLVAIMETMYVVKKDEKYKKMTLFWGKIFLLSFAVGVVTGLIQEFQFGMNWSNYSRFMGDIFGAPLAIEALAAFFMESTFIGLWMFTWDRVSPKLHNAFIWLVAFGSTLSAIWILAANSFMQHPTGFSISNTTGRVELTDFMAVVTNPQLWVQFPHVIFGAWTTAGFVIAGMCAFALLRKKGKVDKPFFMSSMRVSLILGLVGAVLTIAAGDAQTSFIVKDQPLKFAATEGLYKDSGDPAGWTAVALIDTDKKETTPIIEIPQLLSLLTYHKTTGSVKGMETANKELHAKYDKQFGKNMNYYVPTKTLFWSFRLMAGFGTLMALLAIIGLAFLGKTKTNIVKKRWFLWILAICTFAPFVANTCGWLITELGRYPWVVYGLYTIADAVSPNSTVGSLLFSNILYFIVFSTLGGVMVYYSRRTLHEGPIEGAITAEEVDPYAKGAFES